MGPEPITQRDEGRSDAATALTEANPREAASPTINRSEDFTRTQKARAGQRKMGR